MRRFGLTIRRFYHVGLAAAVTALFAPTAFAQDSTSVTTSHSSTTKTSSSVFISDWRVWALVGAVLLVIIIIAVTRRGGGGDTTTIVK